METASDSRSDYYQQLPRKRIAAGAVIFHEERLLLVKPRYKDYWLLPGGVVEANESPLDAVRRECNEELGIEIEFTRMLAVDYTGQLEGGVGDALHFLFLAKDLSTNILPTIKVPDEELESYKLMNLPDALKVLCPRTAKRLRGLGNSIHNFSGSSYLESGFQVFGKT